MAVDIATHGIRGSQQGGARIVRCNRKLRIQSRGVANRYRTGGHFTDEWLPVRTADSEAQFYIIVAEKSMAVIIMTDLTLEPENIPVLAVGA
jgi:hypothetical protein